MTFCNQQPSKPTIKHAVPETPWTKLAEDSFRLYRHYYFLEVDYNSKFISTENLKNSQSRTIMNKCKKIFSQYGIPKELIPDNEPES